MTGAIPPAAAPPSLGSQPSTDGAAAAGQGRAGGRGSTTALVVAQTRHGALIEVGSRRWLVGGTPPMPPGATLSLELGTGGREERSARLLAIRTEGGAERALEPPLAVRLQPASAVPAGRPAIADAPRLAAGIEADARPIGPSGRPVGPPVRLSVAGLAMTDALGQAASELAGWAGRVEFRIADLLPLPEARGAASQQITA